MIEHNFKSYRKGALDFYLQFVLYLVVAGVLAGMLAGLLGIGGGLVLVPVLYYLFMHLGVDTAVCMHIAVGTSLATIIVTSISSAHAHYKKGNVDLPLVKNWGPSLVVGAVVTMSFFGAVKSEGLTAFFSAMTFLIAMYMLFSPSNSVAENAVGRFPKGILRWLTGVLVGCASSLMGIGGGSLAVPLLSYYQYPMHKAVGTSAVVGLLIAIPGTLGAALAGAGKVGLPPFSVGYVNVLAFFILIPLTAFSAPYGARIASSLNPKCLKYAFVLFLIVNSVVMFMQIFD